MIIAITADVHLQSYKETPERYHALKDILQQALTASMDAVLICGDLFDKDFNNYSDFENLAKEFSKLRIWILPGNHDSRVSSRSLVGKNLRIFEKEEIIDAGIPFLIIPYQVGKTMGEAIASKVEFLTPKKWILCGHGDWMEGARAINPLESDAYMPLTRNDLDRYQPARVFLGHIHARSDGTIHYPGSPCGIDITETGDRRFLAFDSSNDEVVSKQIKTDVIFHTANFLILPVENEIDYMRRMILAEKTKWKVDPDDIARTRIRVKVHGYTQDKSALNDLLLEEFNKFLFYNDEEPDLDEVVVTADQNRIMIAERLKERIENLELNPSPDEPDRNLVLMKSLQLVFGS